MTAIDGGVDYWCNAFTPDRRSVWERAIGAQSIPLRIDREGDGFCTPQEMVIRLDETGLSTLVLVASAEPEPTPSGTQDSFEAVAVRADEVAALHTAHPGRFVAVWSIDPSAGMAAVAEARAALDQPWCVGLHCHTHSWDRPFDHADYYPFYALCADEDVPFVMQAGSSGGRFPSGCGHPIGVDRPAIYFPDVRFVLSHTGWPWTTEAIAMTLKFDNVYLGTATYPPRRWSSELVEFLRGVGRTKVLYGSGFPTTGHRQAARQLDELGLDDDRLAQLTGGTARSVFGRLDPPPE